MSDESTEHPAPSETSIRIMIVDDHPVVREGLVALLQRQSDMQVVGEAADGYGALMLYAQHRPDVTLIDLRLPDMDAISVINEVREHTRGARFLIVTTYNVEEDIYRAIRAGARGYLLKDTRRDELVEAVRMVHAGKTYLPPDVSARLVARMDNPEISEKERAILQLIAEGKSNLEIGARLHISEGTVKVHVHRIMRKLAANDRAHAVTQALRRGIIHLQSAQTS